MPVSFGFDVVNPPSCGIAKGVASTANLAAKSLGRKHRLMAVRPAEPNYVDAAIALPTDDIITEIPVIGEPKGVKEASLGMEVQKYGRTTEHTTGSITQVDVTVSVSYGTGKIAIFEGQYITGPMRAGGDSGSAVFDMDGYLVGLLFAGSDSTMIFSPIQKVF